MSDPTTIQRVVFPEDRNAAALYFLAEAADGSGRPLAESEQPRWQRRSLLVPPAVAVSLGTLFNHLPEAYWLTYTKATGFVFRAIVSGAGELHLLRRTRAGDEVTLARQSFDTTAGQAEAALVELRAEAPADRIRGAGVLLVRLIAAAEAAVLGEAEWSALGVEPAPVRLVAGYCTFNREVQLLGNLQAILADSEVRDQLEALVVVDQGGSDGLITAVDSLSRQHDRDLLRLVRQGNFGGSGGFTRVMMEALGIDGATHVLLMDDDARIETESVYRTLRFLSLTANLAVGGQMLDLMLPTVLLETGARVRRKDLGLELIDIFTMAHQPQTLGKFTRVNDTDYNAWWFFAVPLAAVRRLGLPMPMFIRGDDVEYGLRLRAGGVRTVTLPGVAVWHEPFYLKRGWQCYYDMRNMFVLAATRLNLHGAKAARVFLRRALFFLFRYDYGFAALTCRGVEDWLRGPEVLGEDPRPRHAAVAALFASFQVPAVSPDAVRNDRDVAIEPAPRGLARLRRGLAALAVNLFGREKPLAELPIAWIPGETETWWNLLRYRDVAVRPVSIARIAGLKDDWRRLHRSPRRFRALFPQALLLGLRLLLTGGRVSRRWRNAELRLRSSEAWTRRLKGASAVALLPPPAKEEPVAAVELAARA